MAEPVIVAAKRSAVAPRGGALAGTALHDMSAAVIAACLAETGVPPEAVDELVLANAIGEGGNPARIAALAAGLPERVAGLTLDRQCAGGLDALLLARALIVAGQADVVLAGGAESYSGRPRRLRRVGAAWQSYDQAAFTPWPERDPDMTEAAARLALHCGIGRARQDAWAVESHARARAAAGRLGAEIVPVAGLEHDSFTRALTPGLAARARPIAGSITPANAAVAADAAGFCLMVSAAAARRFGLGGMTIRAGATRGGQPDMPGLAPVAAAKEALQKAGMSPDGIVVAEIMEAYAVQALACVDGIGIAPERVNRGGGALARGHPIGASGAILAVRMFHELQPGDTGLAAIAAAGGIGSAVVFTR